MASAGSELLGVIAVGIRPHCHGDSHSASPRVTDSVQFCALEALRQETVPDLHSRRDEGEHVAQRHEWRRVRPIRRVLRRGHVSSSDQVLVVQPRLIPLARAHVDDPLGEARL